MKLPSKPRKGIGQSIADKIGEIIDYLRSITVRSGRGINVQQLDGGLSIGLGKHSQDHAPGGLDEIKFKTLEITDSTEPENPKRIIFNPAWEDFLPGRIFAVNDDGKNTGWRTLLDLLDGLPGFAAGKALIVNVTADGLEFGEAGSELPANVVKESEATPFQAGKLVIASATAHELIGTLIGINLAGAAYQGYSDNAVSTDARVAQISDSRFVALFPSNLIYGTGAAGGIAVFSATQGITSDNLNHLLQLAFGVSSPSKVLFANASGYQLGGIQDVDADAVKKSGSPSDFAIAYFFGGNVIKGLAQPSVDSFLAMDGGTLGLRWVDKSTASLPSTSGKSQYMVLQLDSSLAAKWDYVRAH